MEAVLCVEGLQKTYPGFRLNNVSFTLDQGTITGLIGRNGAGKSTTLKSLLHFIHPDAGKIVYWGKEFSRYEEETKGKIGFVAGEVNFYPNKKLSVITGVTRQFYPNWDEHCYRHCCDRFQLDENKTPRQLSAGMRVKYALTLALSHRAELLILDEPTSGLDPVSREELLEEFLRLAEEEGTTILFSTHITSDLEKCAEHILYIRQGELVEDRPLVELREHYRLVSVQKDQRTPALEGVFSGMRRDRNGYTGLICREKLCQVENLPVREATLEEIMVHLEQEGTK